MLEGLLVNGWLSNVVLAKGHVEKSVAMWTFNLSEFVCNANLLFDTHESFFLFVPLCLSVAYSSIEELRTSACDFWCAILSSKNEVNLIFVLLL